MNQIINKTNMKKQLLLTLALFMVAVGAIAQNVESRISTKRNQSKHHSATSFQHKKNLAKFGENDSSDWYGVLDMMSKSDIGLAGSLKYFVNDERRKRQKQRRNNNCDNQNMISSSGMRLDSQYG